jgi:hypothetical protein
MSNARRQSVQVQIQEQRDLLVVGPDDGAAGGTAVTGMEELEDMIGAELLHPLLHMIMSTRTVVQRYEFTLLVVDYSCVRLYTRTAVRRETVLKYSQYWSTVQLYSYQS